VQDLKAFDMMRKFKFGNYSEGQDSDMCKYINKTDSKIMFPAQSKLEKGRKSFVYRGAGEGGCKSETSLGDSMVKDPAGLPRKLALVSL